MTRRTSARCTSAPSAASSTSEASVAQLLPQLVRPGVVGHVDFARDRQHAPDQVRRHPPQDQPRPGEIPDVRVVNALEDAVVQLALHGLVGQVQGQRPAVQPGQRVAAAVAAVHQAGGQLQAQGAPADLAGDVGRQSGVGDPVGGQEGDRLIEPEVAQRQRLVRDAVDRGPAGHHGPQAGQRALQTGQPLPQVEDEVAAPVLHLLERVQHEHEGLACPPDRPDEVDELALGPRPLVFCHTRVEGRDAAPAPARAGGHGEPGRTSGRPRPTPLLSAWTPRRPGPPRRPAGARGTGRPIAARPRSTG